MTKVSTPELHPQTTDLERRVLAHERILQSLIAYMSRAEPRFLDHLRKTFVEPMAMARREQDFTETDDYAEEFVRAVTALGEAQRSRDRIAIDRRPSGTCTTTGPADASPRERVQILEHDGIWTVSVNSRVMGDYHRREQAEAAAALARLGPS